MATPTTLPASFVSGAVLTAAQMNNLRGGFRILQVASTTKTDTFTSTSTTFTDVTGLSVSITPRENTSKILVIMTAQMNGTSGAANCQYRLMRDTTAIGVGDVAGSRTPATGQAYVPDNNGVVTSSGLVLDSPATTSALTYKVQVRLNTASTLYVNRAPTDTDTAAVARYASTITVLEVSA